MKLETSSWLRYPFESFREEGKEKKRAPQLLLEGRWQQCECCSLPWDLMGRLRRDLRFIGRHAGLSVGRTDKSETRSPNKKTKFCFYLNILETL